MNTKNELDGEALDLNLYQEILNLAWDLQNPSTLITKEAIEKANARIKKRRPEFYKIAEYVSTLILGHSKPLLDSDWKKAIDEGL
jgi:hypothetical protein